MEFITKCNIFLFLPIKGDVFFATLKMKKEREFVISPNLFYKAHMIPNNININNGTPTKSTNIALKINFNNPILLYSFIIEVVLYARLLFYN